MKNKYNNTKLEYNGIKFDSKKEWKHYIKLDERLRKGEIKNLKLQVPYVLIEKQKAPNGSAVREMKYIADFVYDENGETKVVDVKGYRNGGAYNVFKIKKKLMLKIYGIWIEEV